VSLPEFRTLLAVAIWFAALTATSHLVSPKPWRYDAAIAAASMGISLAIVAIVRLVFP
jgi:hypothetical protein